MLRILLLMENKKNSDLLTTLLTSTYEVVQSNSLDSLDALFDLCILDIAILHSIGERIQQRKQAEHPVFLPFLLITAQREREGLRYYLDEIVLIPIEKRELQMRVETLLRTRSLSLDIKLRNEDLESYIQAMTHDLRAPVRAVAGFTEALAEDEATHMTEQGKHYLTMILSATDQITQLITALLGFSRIGREEIEMLPVDMRLVLESCIRALQQQISERHAQIHIEEDLSVVEANPVLLKMVLTNLLSNALKFVPTGTKPIVTISAKAMRHNCRVQIQDNGVGITPENQLRLFTPFVRLHGVEEFPGVGLGLATVRKAIDIMGGSVGITSLPSQGSTFWFELRRPNI
ncbi:MAG: hypothetical protein PVS3B3_22090 [Ktedonobacteraceae bacterium]